MNIVEAMRLAQTNGVRVRRVAWRTRDNRYVVVNKAGNLVLGEDGQSSSYAAGTADILTTDWEVVVSLVFFDVALAALKAGKKVRRSCWQESHAEAWLEPSAEYGIVFVNDAPEQDEPHRVMWRPLLADLLAEDWIVMG